MIPIKMKRWTMLQLTEHGEDDPTSKQEMEELVDSQPELEHHEADNLQVVVIQHKMDLFALAATTLANILALLSTSSMFLELPREAITVKMLQMEDSEHFQDAEDDIASVGKIHTKPEKNNEKELNQ